MYNKIFDRIMLFAVTKPAQPQKSDSSASSKSSGGSASSGSTDSSTDSESSESIISSQPQQKKKETQPSSTNTIASVPPKRPSAAIAPVKSQKTVTKRQGLLIYRFLFNVLSYNIGEEKKNNFVCMNRRYKKR